MGRYIFEGGAFSSLHSAVFPGTLRLTMQVLVSRRPNASVTAGNLSFSGSFSQVIERRGWSN